MANESAGVKIYNLLKQNYILVVPIMVVLCMILPIPKNMIDFLMIINLAFAMLILLVVIRTPRASKFSSFPRIVLFTTTFGIGLNIASTKLILTAEARNASVTQSAMVQTFSNIVAGNNLVIGFVIFIILIVVQVIVITKGATRVSEVAARFTLDSMSQNLFAIDSQLQAGYISEEEAKEKKEDIYRDIDFYSSMDGSSKFVSGNVVAGIFITVINLVGGFATGMALHGLSFFDALNLYTKLTIGDGLLSQLPSLMISLATGILVTGDKSEEALGEKIIKEFTIDGNIFIVVGSALFLMGILFHNQTTVLLIVIGGLLIYYGFALSRKKEVEMIKQSEAEASQKSKAQSNSVDADSVVPLDELSMELGYALIPLVDAEKGAELLNRISKMRRECALDIGLPVPKIRILDNMNLEPDEYCFKIRGIEVGRSRVKINHFMCIDNGLVTEKIKGEETKDPTFGMSAVWVAEDQRVEAEQAGYLVVDPPTVIATYLTETIRTHAADILTREQVKEIIDKVAISNKIVVDEVLSGGDIKFSYGEIEKVLKGLLEEQISIRNTVAILETIANYKAIIKKPWEFVEKVREALGHQICLQYADNSKEISVIQLSQEWAQTMADHAVYPIDNSPPYVAMDPVDGRRWISAVSDTIAQCAQNVLPIIIVPSMPLGLRQVVRSALVNEMPRIVVLSYAELAKGHKEHISLNVIGEIK